MPLFGKFLCFGIAALAMDLVWGYAGILSLGHGLFFALGGYGMGMYLMRSIAGEGVYRSDAARLHGVPRLEAAALVLARLRALRLRDGDGAFGAGRLALVFGWFAFRSRIRGVYFSIVTQALTYAATLLFFQNAAGFGGNNGLTDFKRILGGRCTIPGRARLLYLVVGDRAGRRRTSSAGTSSRAASAAC